MKKLILLIITILVPAILLSQDKGEVKKIRLAVALFDDTLTKAAEQEGSGVTVTNIIENCLKGSDKVYVREKDAIKTYLVNLSQAQAGLVNAESLKGDPESLKVDYLTVGTISKINGRYEVDARTVSINNMMIVYAHGCSAATLKDAVADIEWCIKEKFCNEYIKEREAGDEEKSTVTVYKFRDHNELAAKNGYGGTFAEILNSQLGTYLSMSTLERKYSKALVNEKILEMVGVVDNDNSGDNFKSRGIQYKVEGDIRVFSDVICINYKLYDTSDNSIVFMGSKDLASSAGFRPVAWSISNTVEDMLNNRLGTLKITSTPPGADIYIDGKKEGKSPAEITVQRGQRKLLVKKDGYIPYKADIEIMAKKELQQQVVLQEVPYKILQNAMQFERKRDWAGAIAAYSDFINNYIDTKEADQAYYRKGHLEMMYMKNNQNALSTFEALVKRYPDAVIRAEGYYGMMRAYEFMGNKEKAKEIKQYILDYYGETNAAAEARKIFY